MSQCEEDNDHNEKKAKDKASKDYLKKTEAHALANKVALKQKNATTKHFNDNILFVFSCVLIFGICFMSDFASRGLQRLFPVRH